MEMEQKIYNQKLPFKENLRLILEELLIKCEDVDCDFKECDFEIRFKENESIKTEGKIEINTKPIFAVECEKYNIINKIKYIIGSKYRRLKEESIKVIYFNLDLYNRNKLYNGVILNNYIKFLYEDYDFERDFSSFKNFIINEKKLNFINYVKDNPSLYIDRLYIILDSLPFNISNSILIFNPMEIFEHKQAEKGFYVDNKNKFSPILFDSPYINRY